MLYVLRQQKIFFDFYILWIGNKTTEIKWSNIFTEIKQSNINLIKLISKLKYLMKTVKERLIDLEALLICPVYDNFEVGRRK